MTLFLYLVWVGSPLHPSSIKDTLYKMGVSKVECTVLGAHFAAQLRFSRPADRQKVLDAKQVVVGRRITIVSEENPVAEWDSRSLSLSGNSGGTDSQHDLMSMLPPPPLLFAFPATACPHLSDESTESCPETPTLTTEFPSMVLRRKMTSTLLYERRKPNVYKVCLTGGPCAGKTTVLSTIISKFNAQGIRTYAVPEVATTLICGGMSFNDMTAEKSLAYQSVILQMQLSLEQHFLDVAMADEGPALIISDRGTMDGKAYCDDATWTTILAQVGLSNVQLRDQQYDAVYHLVTAADGAEEYYGNETNAIRRETPEEARVLDGKTLSAYLGHPHLRIIDNSTNFARKVERVLTSISEGMGVTLPTGIYRRYLVAPPAPTNLPVPTVAIDIQIGILRQPDPEVEVRIISRGQDGRYSYFLQELRDVKDTPVITERKLTPDEYRDHKKHIDEDLEIIQKSSLAFTYNNQYFELGTIITPTLYAGTVLLYIESSGIPDLPPFIPVIKDVTDDPKYYNMAVSQTDYSPMDAVLSKTVSMYSMMSCEDAEENQYENTVAQLENMMSTRTLSVSLTMNLQSQNFSLKSFKFRPGQHRRSIAFAPRVRQCSVYSAESVEVGEDPPQ